MITSDSSTPDGAMVTRLAAEAWEELFRAQVTIMRRFEARSDFAPLTSREYDVLFQLVRDPSGGLRMHELNTRILLSQPSLSRMIDRLELRGLVRRQIAPEDARGVIVTITDSGREIQRAVGRRHVNSIRRFVGSALAEDELRELAGLARRLRAAQDDIA